MPAPSQAALEGWLCKATGVAVLVGCAAAGVSLLTWSVGDPSLMHATSGATRNAFGPLGAIISDLLMQMLGLGGVVMVLPPLFWALQMLTHGRFDRARPKLVMAPAAGVMLAAALSSIPAPAGWPLTHGLGGFLGDRGLMFAANILALVNPGTAPIAAGLFFFAGGLMLLVHSLGLTQQDIRLIFDVDPKQGIIGLGRFLRRARDAVTARGEPMLKPRPVEEPDERAPEPNVRQEPVFRAEPRMPDLPRVEPVRAEPPLRLDIPAPNFPPSVPPFEHAPRAEPTYGSDRAHEPSFDHSTDRESHKIARRFAPGGMDMARVQPGVELLDDEPDTSDVPTVPVRPAAQPPQLPTARPEPETYLRPPINLLRRPQSVKPGLDMSEPALQARARQLEEVLGDFGVRGEVKAINPGPVVTLFEYEPARGVKSSRVTNLADDIARAMSAQSVRVAVVPGRNAIGIELPNARRETVFLRELIDADAFRASDAALPLVLGKTISGTPVFSDLARMPHLLVAGTTGSGKSVGVNAMILSLLYRLPPEQCRMIMIDPKMLELSVYNGIPHLLCPVVTDPQRAVAALNWVVREMEDRYRRMAKLAVRNIDAFNGRLRLAQQRAPDDADFAPMPYIVVVVDEFADLMMVAGKEIEAAVQRLAQMARAAGIHLIMATQRPSVDIITGTIKANFPTRISFKVASKFDSRTILNEQGAEQLLGQGDMLFWGGNGRSLRVHGPFVSDEEVEAIARFLGEQGEPRYVMGITDVPEDAAADDASGPAASDDAQDLFARAVALVLEDGKASTSYLQRRLGIGYNRAADLIDRMEEEGVISPPGPQGRRMILRDRF